ncbi:hypothetical protein U9M48_043463 [Paspalum notatum var. saurae]|uniref:DUF4216 domain-containing protein n=1 Tax=Paspalum notatum var. saurae TaxID=547442 RepID=A0AAQ3UT68_PASNO
MPNYLVRHKHGERGQRIDQGVDLHEDHDRMDEMLNDLGMGVDRTSVRQGQLPPEVEELYRLLDASDERLHDYTQSTLLQTLTRLMSIKSKHNISNTAYNDIVKIIDDILPENHKLPKNLYFAKKILAGLGKKYEKIDVRPNNCIMFWEKDGTDKLDCCNQCNASRYVQVTNEEGDSVTTKVAAKQLHYMQPDSRFLRILLNKETAMHMRWPTEGKRENKDDDIMEHPVDGDAWKALDNFDLEFAKDPRSIRFGLSTDGFTPFNTNASPYSCWPVFIIPYNLPPELVNKDKYMFLALVIPGPEHPGPKLNMFMRPLFKDLKRLWRVSKSLMKKFEKEIPVLVCKLEMVFPPGFMNVMQHLLVHLAWEALVGGPVQFRWMYAIERGLEKLKATVRNKARVEGCIAEAFALKEISHFSSKYFAQRNNVFAPTHRVQMDDEAPQGNLKIFKHQGRPVGCSTVRHLEESELNLLLLYMYINMEETIGYIQLFDEECWKGSSLPTHTQLENMQRDGFKGGPNFVQWWRRYAFANKVHDDLKQLTHMYVTARNYGRYDVNGYHFRTAKLEKSRPLAATVNSGVMTSAYDDSDNIVNYYGVLQNIVELVFGDPKELKVVFFECDWFDPRNGTRIDKYGMVEVKHSSRFPSRINSVVLANEAQQVYYLPYPHPTFKAWWVAFKVNPQMMFRHRSRSKGKGASEDSSSSGLFQGTTQSRQRKEQLLGCLQAQAQEEAEQEAAQEEAEQEAPQEEAETGDPMREGVVAGGSSAVTRFRFRKCNSVRPRPAERVLIKPRGEWQWEDVTWDGTGRRSKVNSVLGGLCRYYYPGMVEVDGEKQAALQWRHWSLKEYVRADEGSSAGGSSEGGSSQTRQRTCASVVWDEFWLRYRLENEDDTEVLQRVRRHFCRAAEKVIDDAFYNARILAVCQYYKKVKGENMSKEKGAAQIYLTEEEYLQTSVDWIVTEKEAWRWLAKRWASEDWIASSKSHRENRGTTAPGHQYGADGHFALTKRMEAEKGVALSFMEVYVHAHRGPDPTNPEVLCTEAAKKKMHRGCGLRPQYISSKELQFVGWEFSLLKDSSTNPGRGGGSCSTRGGLSGNTEGRAADNHDSVPGFLRSGYHSSIGTGRKLATLLPSSNVSAAGVDRVGATPRVAATSGVDDGTPGLSATSVVDDGTPGLPATSWVDGTAGLSATYGMDGTAGLPASSGVDGTAGLPASSGVDDTPRLTASSGVDGSTQLQPVDAITSSALWIPGIHTKAGNLSIS